MLLNSPLRRRLVVATLLCAIGPIWGNGCGGRTETSAGETRPRLDAGGPFANAQEAQGAECESDTDCVTTDECLPSECISGRCEAKAPIDCDDADPCTLDYCEPDTGECTHTHATPDLDGDGYHAPRVGEAPGSVAACGNDCDDTSASAHPGGTETCDGRDNDCNGVVDDGYTYVPSTRAPVLISTGERAGVGGVTHNGEFFAVSMSYNEGHQQNQLTAVSNAGDVEFRKDIALVNSDTFAGPIVWTGRAFASAWEDRRDRDYEIYFNRLDSEGNKLGPDLRISDAIDFSLNPDLTYTGDEYIVLWDDRRSGAFHVYGQRVSRDGELLGGNVDLTPEQRASESPSVTTGTTTLGFSFNAEFDEGRRIVFRSVNLDLTQLGESVVLSGAGGVGAGIIFMRDRYIVSWSEYDAFPGDAIWAAALSESGDLLTAPQRITPPAEFARSYSMVDLGDRLMVFWGSYQDGSYDVMSQLLDVNLQPISMPQQITHVTGDALSPAARLGNEGNLGVAYTDFSEGTPKVYFTTLSCE